MCRSSPSSPWRRSRLVFCFMLVEWSALDLSNYWIGYTTPVSSTQKSTQVPNVARPSRHEKIRVSFFHWPYSVVCVWSRCKWLLVNATHYPLVLPNFSSVWSYSQFVCKGKKKTISWRSDLSLSASPVGSRWKLFLVTPIGCVCSLF